MTVSFFEIYGSELYDLLNQRNRLIVRLPPSGLTAAPICTGSGPTPATSALGLG